MKQRLARIAYAASFPVLTGVAFGSIVGSALMLAQPDVMAQTAIGAALPWPAQMIWTASVLVGAVVLAYGVLRPHAGPEVFGCLVLSGAYAGYPLALASERSSSAQFVAAVFLGLSAGLLVRALLLRYAPPTPRIGGDARSR